MSSTGRTAVEAITEDILKELEGNKGITVTAKALFKNVRDVYKDLNFIFVLQEFRQELFDESINELRKKETIVRSGERIRYLAVEN